MVTYKHQKKKYIPCSKSLSLALKVRPGKSRLFVLPIPLATLNVIDTRIFFTIFWVKCLVTLSFPIDDRVGCRLQEGASMLEVEVCIVSK